MSYDVFISHSSKDKALADAVCAALEANGVRCWIAPRDILPSESWAAAILRGISESRMMVLIFSANANGSQHVHREVERAVAHNMPVLPVRIEDVLPAAELEYFLSSAHWLNALKPPFEQHLRDLASTVRAVLQSRGGSPAAPPNLVAAAPSPVQRPPPSPGPSFVAPARPRSRAPLVLAMCAVLLVVLGGLGVSALLLWNKLLPGQAVLGPPAGSVSGPQSKSAATPVGATPLPSVTSSEQRTIEPTPPAVTQPGPVAPNAHSGPVALAPQTTTSAPVEVAVTPTTTPTTPAGISARNPLEQPGPTQIPATRPSLTSPAPAVNPLETPTVQVDPNTAAQALEDARRREAERVKVAADKAAAEKLAADKLATEKLAAQRTAHISDLLSTAQSNDSPENGQAALTALNEALKLDPNNAKALELQQRISAYYAKEFINSLKMKFVRIEAGEFMMGTAPLELGHAIDELQHTVKISKPFMLGVYPVTQAQWVALMGDNPSEFKGDELPVEKVSWEDAVKFCQKLSAKEQKHYRLPTEAQWEYACRAGTTTPFYFGRTITSDLANYDARTTYGPGLKGLWRDKTTQVGIFKPNAWGLYDMCGNVAQWCSDWYEPYPPGNVTDPVGPANPLPNHVWHVLRGGSYSSSATLCRSGARYKSAPDNRFSFNGFRVALDIGPGPEHTRPPGS